MSKYKLVDEVTGSEIFVPSERKTFRGEVVTVVGYSPPKTSNSTGRVYARSEGDQWQSEWYPGVIGAKIVETEDSDVEEGL